MRLSVYVAALIHVATLIRKKKKKKNREIDLLKGMVKILSKASLTFRRYNHGQIKHKLTYQSHTPRHTEMFLLYIMFSFRYIH